ncbi:MAG: hypothetical protein JOZ41_13975 [Chloroflexi bacterium]|nr:hypothetical protein [Chloroflexota bacterium]
MSTLIRSLLLFALFVCVVILVAAHGFVRAVAVLMALVVVTTLPKTRAWQMGERWLVRITGSRRRAALVALLVVIGALAVINIYNITH